MPVFDVGYREWVGRRDPSWRRFWVIAATGIRLAWKNQWLRRMLFLAWLPAIYMGIAFFFFERAMKEEVGEQVIRVVAGFVPAGSSMVPQVFKSGVAERRPVWSYLLMTLFRYPQGILMVMLVGLVAPPLISRDLRTRGHLLYFSRPLGIAEYLLGKFFVVGAYLLLISTLPALTLYVLGVMLSPDLSVLWDTWDLPLRILAASLVVIIPTTSIALCFSSLTEETRYASFGWFAIWVVGWVAYAVLTAMDLALLHSSPSETVSRWTMVSLYHLLGELQTWIFGFEVVRGRVWFSAGLLAGLTAVSLAIIYRRLWALHRT